MSFEKRELGEALSVQTEPAPLFLLKEALVYGDTLSKEAAIDVLGNPGDPNTARLVRDLLTFAIDIVDS